MTEVAPAPLLPSPCIGVCEINEQTGWCEGCWRTLDEITAWSTADESLKHAIWQKIQLRMQGAGE